MTCPHCNSGGRVIEVRRTQRRGLRRTLRCYGCSKLFCIYGGATEHEMERARQVLRERGYLHPIAPAEAPVPARDVWSFAST